MSPAATGPAFGAFLKRLRKQAGLTLRQVAEYSNEAAPDTAGRISDGYLSSIEQGRPVAVSLLKLAALADIYGVALDELIESAPPPHRQRLWEEKNRLSREGRLRLPDTRGLRMAARHKVNAQIYGRLAALADGVAIPINSEVPAKELIHYTIVRASCIPAALEGSPTTLATDFAGRWPEPIDMLRRRTIPDVAILWSQASDTFCSHLLYERGIGDAIIKPISSWSLDFSTELATCHFSDKATDDRLGYDRVPVRVVQAAGKARITRFLASAFPELDSPEPAMHAAAREYLVRLLDPIRDQAQFARVPITGAVAAAMDLAKRLPDLKPQTDAYDRSTHQAVITFLTKLSDRHAGRPRRPRTKPQR